MNAAYPEQHTYDYSMGEEATYSGQNSSGENVESGAIVVKALDFRSVGYEQIKDIDPEYEASSIEDGSSSDMRAFLVDVQISNNSNDVQNVHIRDFNMESGAWTNGLYAPLYMNINNDPSTIVELQPDEKIERTLAYLIFDTQVNNRADWDKVEQRDYSLELALYPDKYLIELGVPAVGGREGGAA